MKTLSKVLLVVAGLYGALGVAAAAGASHEDSRNLSAIATIFLAHAPALLAAGLFGRDRFLLVAASILALGSALFGADLTLRELWGHGLFPGAAPLSGGVMILAWLAISLAGLRGGPRS